MKALGGTTLVIAILAFAIGIVIGIRSIPDMKRYLEMRKM